MLVSFWILITIVELFLDDLNNIASSPSIMIFISHFVDQACLIISNIRDQVNNFICFSQVGRRVHTHEYQYIQVSEGVSPGDRNFFVCDIHFGLHGMEDFLFLSISLIKFMSSKDHKIVCSEAEFDFNEGN